MAENVSNSLVNLGDLSRPATVLIEKIADAVGAVFAPYQVKRLGKAEAEVALIKAEANIKITDLQRRALQRFVEEESQRQLNIESIASKAIPQLSEGSAPEKIQKDWLTNFFDKCRIVSDDEMQSLWSRVLAGEANRPGSYSTRTVNFLSTLDRKDAEQFATLCRFIWEIEITVPLIYNTSSEVYSKNGLTFEILNHLESIGLIQFNEVSSFAHSNLPKTVYARYFERTLRLEFMNSTGNFFRLGTALLTKTGLELVPLSSSKPAEGFWEYIVDVCNRYSPTEVKDYSPQSDGTQREVRISASGRIGGWPA
jgi:hypothetical protein